VILTNINKEVFRLEIVRYQYPELLTPLDYDSNWLIIKIEVYKDGKNWNRSDPALLTWEAEQIISWFRDVAANKLVNTPLEFIEPNLSFSLQHLGNKKQFIRLSLDLEFLPVPYDDEDDCFIDFPIHPEMLVTAALDLEVNLSRFPQR
jgi:hypothetical protein